MNLTKETKHITTLEKTSANAATSLIRLVVAIIMLCAPLHAYCAPSIDSNTTEFYNRLQQQSSEQLYQKALEYRSQSDKIDSALVCYTVLSNRVDKCRNKADRILCIKAYTQMAYIYYFTYFDYSKAMEYMVKAQELMDMWNEEVAEVPLFYGLMYGSIAEQTQDDKTHRKAFDFMHDAFYTSMRQGNRTNANLAYCNLISKAFNLEMTDSLQSLIRAYGAFKAEADKDKYHTLFNTSLGKGLQAIQSKRYDDALKQFDHILSSLPETVDFSRYRCGAEEYKAIVYEKMGDDANARDHYLKALDIAIKYNLLDAKIELYDILSKYAKKHGDSAQHLDYLNHYLTLKDSLLNFQQIASIDETHLHSEMRKAEREIQKADNRRKSLEVSLTVGAIILLFVLAAAVIIYRQNRKLKLRNESLFSKNQEVMRAEESERNLRNRYQKELDELRKAAAKPMAETPQEQPAASDTDDDNSVKYKSSSLSDDRRNDLADRIKQVMESPEIFSADFSAERLANILDEKYKYVSQTISEVFGYNFNTLLSNYRIREACKRIVDEENFGNLTMEALAWSVGFKSRSTFAVQFKRVTGLTPSQYIAEARKHQ